VDTRKSIVYTITASLLVLAACATSPEDERKRMEMEADIDDILSYEHDPLEYGEVKPCLSTSEYQTYRALGNRHLLFEGRKGKLWVNVLRGRCLGLHDNSVFIMRPTQANRLCDKDRFEAVDRLDMHRVGSPTCVLGEFKPVTEAQVKEIRDRMDMR
jgi:hypothetical protein